ncbi:glycosyltransferase family 2 protein [Pedobacter insulae]|uniref:Glycosyltransferase involved in cell wall bisynthesis n=1 Tax=Pedobacter insulae TaxID=414048 RepID=A0A1I2VVD2_9SPHI|nr:glycosyltransferase family A protein [Pedobacter insulae]SFG93070.1 Glycosyltransferase involved in cell wall bisynthesis [Pedobacter insulae]
MKSESPLVSIIVPCYMQAKYLEDALKSVLDQNYQNWECIIIDDGSPDETEIISREWEKKDKRFIYIRKTNGGLSSARNSGIVLAKGEFILPLDADDKIGKEYIQQAIELFTTSRNTTLIYCKAVNFGAENKEWELGVYSYSNLLISNMIFCSAIYRKSDAVRINGYDENLKNGLEDWDFWIRLLDKNSNVVQLKTIGFYYRLKESSMIKNLHETENLFKLVKREIYIKNIEIYDEHFGEIHAILKKQLHLIGFEKRVKSMIAYRLLNSIKSFLIKN